MYTVEKPKFLDILKLIPFDGCNSADLRRNSIRSKDYVFAALKYWEGQEVLTLSKKSKDPRYLWIKLTSKGTDVKRIYDILTNVMDYKVKEFNVGEKYE